MIKVVEGKLVAKGKCFGVVISRFNDFISKQLLSGCIDTLVRHGTDEKDIRVVWVPGAFEIPLLAQRLAKQKEIDAVICLGAIIRGSTPHFDYIASEAAKGIARVGLAANKPLTFGIITADTIEQAIERAGAKDGNKGRDAALNAIEMVDVVAHA